MEPADHDLWSAAGELLGVTVTPLEGGFSGETFQAEVAGDPVVLRLYARDPERVAVDVGLLRLMRGLVPVPEVLDWRAPSPDGFGAFLLTERLPGRRLDLVLPTADADLRHKLGASVGEVMARLSGVPYLHPGRFADGSLALVPMDGALQDLETWVAEHARRPPLSSWPAAEREGLAVAALVGAELLDRVDRTCLVHSDLNPKNVLVDPVSGAVTGLLDWEYAYAGGPASDLGNLLRFSPPADFADAAVAGLRAVAPRLPEDLLSTAAAADLFALVELAARTTENSVVLAARARLERIAAARSPRPGADRLD